MLKKKLYSEPRRGVFEHAQFGHGKRGPVTRKALLRELALLCPVILGDEFRTSMCCHSCGYVLGSTTARVCCVAETTQQAGAGAQWTKSIEILTRAMSGRAELAYYWAWRALPISIAKLPRSATPIRSTVVY